jgi:hypothetical protein
MAGTLVDLDFPGATQHHHADAYPRQSTVRYLRGSAVMASHLPG